MYKIPRVSPLALSLSAYIGAWVGLTAAGAAIFSIAHDEFLGWVGFGARGEFARLGGADYWLFLIAPILLVPASALLAYNLSRRGMDYVPVLNGGSFSHASGAVLHGIFFLSAAYCLYLLSANNHLLPDILFQAGSYDLNIQKRANLMRELRFTFYAVTYAIIPIVSCMFFAKWLENGKVSDLIGVVLTFLFAYYLFLSIYMKAPFAVYFAMLILTAIICRASIFWIPAIFTLSILTFATMQALIGGLGSPEVEHPPAITQPAPATQAPVAPPEPKAPAPVAEAPSRPASPPVASADPSAQPATGPSVTAPPDGKEATPLAPFPTAAEAPPGTGFGLAILKHSLFQTPKNLFFRMGSAYPFYIGMFDDPEERCGLESNRIPLLPTPDCVLASKVFAAMYPEITNVVGMAPAAAHVSALGEFGPWWAIVVLLLAGGSIGVLSAVGSRLGGVAGAGLSVAACVYAYYLTQVPLLGALTYSHGLVFFLLPVAVVLAASLLRPSTSFNKSLQAGPNAG